MKLPASEQKLRGGYYTPSPIAHFLAKWAIGTSTSSILEPSCGDGNILFAATEVLNEQQKYSCSTQVILQGVEFDQIEAKKAMDRLNAHGQPVAASIHTGDFFAFCREKLWDGTKYDVVVGNPPFIRYQHFLEEQRSEAFALMKLAGMNPTRLTNAWVPFLIASTLLLDEHGGRIAMVIPAELLQVNYAAEVRQFLSDRYSRISLLTFSKLIFPEIQQEVVLFLGERNGHERTGIRTIELNSVDDLMQYEHQNLASTELKVMDHSSDKWTQYFLDQKEIDLLKSLQAHPQVISSGKILDVDVGIVTGLNEYFVLSDEAAIHESLKEFTDPIVTRSGQLTGILYSNDDLELAHTNGQACRILRVPEPSYNDLPLPLQHYISKGELKGVHEGYKCRIRKKWYVVPSVWTPDAFMLRQVHAYPKLVLNQTSATCTDTIHRVRFIGELSGKSAALAFLNSMTFAFAEVLGRSYGGGVLELEPSEAESLPMSIVGTDSLCFDEINNLVCSGNIQAALRLTDTALLKDGLGLADSDIVMLRSIWSKLRDRRQNRKHSKR